MPSEKFIDLAKTLPKGHFRTLCQKTLVPAFEELLGIATMNRLHSQLLSQKKISQETNFYRGSLDVLEVDYEIVHGSLENIPQSGPVIVVANHPFGGLDGLIFGDILKKVRPDSKLLANFLLAQIPELHDEIISVSPFGSNKATQFNRSGLKEAMAFLEEGGCLGTFPSGFVSHFQGTKSGIVDKPWNPITARLARKSNATVVPLFFEGYNSCLFELAGMIHPRLRTALLPRQLVNKMGETIRVRIGSPITPTRIQAFDKHEDAAKYFQMRSSILAHKAPQLNAKTTTDSTVERIANRKPVDDFLDDLKNLPDDCLLTEKGVFQVYSAQAKQIPNILHEIGRTRELTFRPVGEGTGKPLDLDQYDEHYHHLFLWNNETCEIVGAYRIGLVQEILNQHSAKGLYSNTIFEYSDDAFDELGGALELGRSYIVPEYQRKGTSLFLLWRGIIKFVRKNPGYSKLFGAVSISDEYHPLSKALIVHFLKNRKMVSGYEDKIKARIRPSFEKNHSLHHFNYPNSLPSLDHISSLVSELEHDSKGVPTLLKHYLQLNGVILGIGVDGGFNDALDGFIMVDLDKVDPVLLQKYEGKQKSLNQ